MAIWGIRFSIFPVVFVRLLTVVLFALSFDSLSAQQLSLPKRVVSLAPNTTEIVFALEQAGLLVGVTNQCDHPTQALEKQRVGDIMSPSLEKTIALKPNLVLSGEITPSQIQETLKKSGIAVHRIAPATVLEIPDAVNVVGALLGAEKQAKELAKNILVSVHAYQASAGERIRRGKNKAIILVQLNPPIAAGKQSWLGDILVRGGFENIVPASPMAWPRLSREFLFSHKTDLVLIDRSAANGNVSEKELLAQAALFWKGSSSSPQFVVMPRDVLVRPGPRIIQGLQFLQGLN